MDSLIGYINTCAKNASRKWPRNYEDSEDYIQIGLMALVIANKNWPGNGRFEFYAKRVISRLINSAAKHNKGVVVKQLDDVFLECDYLLDDLLMFDTINDEDKQFLINVLDNNLDMTKHQKYRRMQKIRKILKQ